MLNFHIVLNITIWRGTTVKSEIQSNYTLIPTATVNTVCTLFQLRCKHSFRFFFTNIQLMQPLWITCTLTYRLKCMTHVVVIRTDKLYFVLFFRRWTYRNFFTALLNYIFIYTHGIWGTERLTNVKVLLVRLAQYSVTYTFKYRPWKKMCHGSTHFLAVGIFSSFFSEYQWEISYHFLIDVFC